MAAQEFRFRYNGGVHGHIVHFSTSNGGPRKGIFRRYVTPPSATVRCSCDAIITLARRDIVGRVSYWQETMAFYHYLDVLAVAQIEGVEAVMCPPHTPEDSTELLNENPPELVPHPDDYFGWRNPALPLPDSLR